MAEEKTEEVGAAAGREENRDGREAGGEARKEARRRRSGKRARVSMSERRKELGARSECDDQILIACDDKSKSKALDI